ncbi:helix-turn-helix transcriptional regulator [Streptomyces nigra]|uniref:helix-turn-helix transcriptional regulator n=1 Tax=Streptomyces nigra TaxID=1827580 RepID=UPI00381ADBA7
MASLNTPMVGRQTEYEHLSSLLSADTGQALVIRGEAGLGKSALLGYVAEQASLQGYDCVRAVGVEAEWTTPFSGLHQLLDPLLQTCPAAAGAHRHLFDVIFGRELGEAPSLLAVGVATLDVLRAASSVTPLLVLLDDSQWLDTLSADVCGFVGRRLSGSNIKMVIAVRSDGIEPFDGAALPEICLTPLGDESARFLLKTHHPELDEETQRLVLEHAEGNPLALLELPHHISDTQQGSGGPSFLSTGDVPLPRRLEHMFASRVKQLMRTERDELLRAALDGLGSKKAPCPQESHYRMRSITGSLANGLLVIDPVTGEPAFRHPLVRSTLVQLATPNERRAAHADLAQIYPHDVERRAAHLAAATLDPDDDVARTLDDAARSATQRGSSATAVAWLTRAAELSEHAAERSRRLGDAAFIAGQAALMDQAQHILDSQRPVSGTDSPALVITSAYLGLYQHGDVRSTHRQVAAAAESLSVNSGAGSRELLTRLLNLLLVTSMYAGDSDAWQRTERIFEAVADRVDPLTTLCRDAVSDMARIGSNVSARLDRVLSDVTAMPPWDATFLTVAAYYADVLWRYRPHLERLVAREQNCGAVSNVMTLLHLVMLDQFASGDWTEAERTGRQVLDLTRTHGNELFRQRSKAHLGLLAAARGDVSQAREIGASVSAWCEPRGVGCLVETAKAIDMTASLSEGDYEAAYLSATSITSPGTFTPYAPQASRTLLDLVEAALHTGRKKEARLHALAARDAGLAERSPRLALLTWGTLAMTTEDESTAETLFARAEAGSSGSNFPFELARIQLAHGTRLRHGRNQRGAREILQRAAETFDRLGATPWARRAHTELRASGTGVPSFTNPQELTWQERRIADLAASGMTNRQIGERMFLSPRTVGSHLYHIFPKLGITSRAALRDALSRADDARTPAEHT